MTNTSATMLAFLRNSARMAQHAQTKAGRSELQRWETMLEGQQSAHQAIVDAATEGLALIRRTLAEVQA